MIDSHQHFWKFDPVRDSWIDESMSVIQRDLLPADLKPILDKNGFAGCVVVQTDQSKAENDFLLDIAGKNDFVKGVVGWVDLRAGDINEQLEDYSRFAALKGFRHVLQGETDRALMVNDKFMNGIKALKRFDFTYDMLIFPDQLIYTHTFVKAFPDQKFVIDHIAKPPIKDKKIDEWAKDMKALAAFDNVWCKVSGMVTEANWQTWKEEDFEPYLDVVFEAFGTKRLMFGSDWPVCNVVGGYDRILGIVKNYTSNLSAAEQADFLGNNATEFYKLGQ